MRHDHGIRIGGALLVAILMAAPALAQTKHALAYVTTTGACCGYGSYPQLYGYVDAFVGSTPNAPSVYIRSNVLSRHDTTIWHNPPYTPTSTNYNDVYNAAVTFKRSHPLAPTATTTVDAADKTNTAVGGAHYFPRAGIMRQKPGPNRFGGTMALVSNLRTKGVYKASVGFYNFTGMANATPMITGPVSVGQYGFALSGKLIHQSLSWKGQPLALNAPVIATFMPSTTGTQYLNQPFGDNVTIYTYTGYDNRTPNGMYGTLSLVRPMVLQYFFTEVALPHNVVDTENQGFMYRTTITFLPEPGSLLMLGCGILTLAGLFRLRMR